MLKIKVNHANAVLRTSHAPRYILYTAGGVEILKFLLATIPPTSMQTFPLNVTSLLLYAWKITKGAYRRPMDQNSEKHHQDASRSRDLSRI